MDDRTARGRENANREQRAPTSAQSNQSSQNGRMSDADELQADRRSSSPKPALTQREREEQWPLG